MLLFVTCCKIFNHTISKMHWKSAISSDIIVKCTNHINELQINFMNKALLWNESFTTCGGGNIIYGILDKNIVKYTSSDYNVCSKVHEYGGNSFCVNEETLFFVNKSDQKIYQTLLKKFKANAVTPKGDYRYTCLHFDNKNSILFAVCEQHFITHENEPKNFIIALCQNHSIVEGINNDFIVIVQGADFYSDPCVSPDGTIIAWQQWFHPNMPWDVSEICIGNLIIDRNDALKITNISVKNQLKISMPHTSYMQPKIANFSTKNPNSYTLFYLSDANGFYNLYMRDVLFDPALGTLQLGAESQPLVIQNANKHKVRDVGFPLWVTGNWAYDFDPVDPSVIVASAENDLYVLNLDGTHLKTPATVTNSYNCACVYRGDTFNIATLCDIKVVKLNTTTYKAYAIASPKNATEFIASFCISFPTPGTGTSSLPVCEMEIVHKVSEDVIDPGYISEAEEITFLIPSDGQSDENSGAHRNKNISEGYAYLYGPKNKDYPSTDSQFASPLIVISHGGPTAKEYPSFDLKKTQFFTSRGYAVLHVNYRGSFGYGKAYRDALYGKWGIYDVNDCCSAALHVAHVLKRCDPGLMFITGSSSGGYTTLACLTFRPEVFRAGVSFYGICDLNALIADTHKFEAYYTQNLVEGFKDATKLNPNNTSSKQFETPVINGVGDTAKNLQSEYDKRSPINYIDSICAPIAFFHGKQDKVVLPNQAIVMYEKLKAKGILTELTLFENEGHGFRDAKNIKVALEKELAFFDNIVKEYRSKS